jgi:Domain of unknown function (DUF6602)
MKTHYAGLTDRMLSEIRTTSSRMTHDGEMGRNNELVLADVLNKTLPRRYSVSTGKVVAVGGVESDQMDLIVHDRVHTPALIDARAWSLVPVETTYAVVAVKTTLTKPELRDAMAAIASARKLPRKAAIRYDADHKVELGEEETLRPRGFVFAFKSSWATPENADAAFRDTLQDVDDGLRPNAVCLLDQCLLIRKAYTTETIVFKEHALLHFFVFLIRAMDTFPRYQVDLARYFDADYGDIPQ